MVASVAVDLVIHYPFKRSGRERDCEPRSELARVVEVKKKLVAHHLFVVAVYHGVKEDEEAAQTWSCCVPPPTLV
ncbi:hypothetical protein V6N13_042583 [Hibiscus sabdariffa]|uniref:Uncharacterized protein n=1 Tax=Hibiscus sabdariffa TaxID=183260 RepID=A0ABR2G4D6_9ROSI